MDEEDGLFSFDNVDVEVRPMVTTPLPGSGAHHPPATSTSLHPLPGTLFGGSPRVASGVTRGDKKEETRVRLVHVSDPAEICGGVIGAVDNKKFCATHPSQCEHRLTHAKRKFDLVANTLYVMSPKRGAVHATLEPNLSGTCVPANKELVYFDGCRSLEESTGENE
jgi:hypothetical protein